MKRFQLGTMENKFATLIWKHEPIGTRDLAELSEKEFDWKRTTMYTMLKRLIDRGLFENTNGEVTAIISQEQFATQQGEALVEESFGGSLPSFVAAFSRHNSLSEEDIAQLQQLIDDHTE